MAKVKTRVETGVKFFLTLTLHSNRRLVKKPSCTWQETFKEKMQKEYLAMDRHTFSTYYNMLRFCNEKCGYLDSITNLTDLDGRTYVEFKFGFISAKQMEEFRNLLTNVLHIA